MTLAVTAQTEVNGSLAVARAWYDSGDYRTAIPLCEVGLAHAATDTHRLSLLLLKACCEGEIAEFEKSLETLRLAGPLIDNAPADHQAKFYGQRAYARVKLGRQKEAFVDYEAARFWAQIAGDIATEGAVRNNLAKVYSNLGRFDEAVHESDAAIRIAIKLDATYLGRFYDQRAQILNQNKMYEEALPFSEKAIRLLSDHPSLSEARTTHGESLIGMGGTYLNNADPVENFRIRRSLANSIDTTLDAHTLRLALDRCGGNVHRAASLLNVKHQALLKAVKKFGLESHQRKHLRRSIIKAK